MISLSQALALAVGPANVAAAGHAVADWFDGRDCPGAADVIRKQLQDYVAPHNRPDTSLRAELMAELASQQEVVSSLRERVERLERRWAKETAGGDKLDRLIAQDRADEPAVPGSQRLATHPDGTPMISIGKAEDLNTIARLAADPEHARAVLADEPAAPEDMEPAAVVGEPSDEELLYIAAQAIEPYDTIRLGEYEAENECVIEVYGSELIAFARAVLARWGRQPTPPGNKNTPASPESTEMNRD